MLAHSHFQLKSERLSTCCGIATLGHMLGSLFPSLPCAFQYFGSVGIHSTRLFSTTLRTGRTYEECWERSNHTASQSTSTRVTQHTSNFICPITTTHFHQAAVLQRYSRALSRRRPVFEAALMHFWTKNLFLFFLPFFFYHHCK